MKFLVFVAVGAFWPILLNSPPSSIFASTKTLCNANTQPGTSCFEYVGTYGVRCFGYSPNGNQNAARSEPVSYPAIALGKPGVPKLRFIDAQTVASIARRKPRTALRFVTLPRFGLVVFDANRGPCLDAAGGYPVLNLPPNARFFYEPGENPENLHASPP